LSATVQPSSAVERCNRVITDATTPSASIGMIGDVRAQNIAEIDMRPSQAK
jgi:hypothetical protein